MGFQMRFTEVNESNWKFQTLSRMLVETTVTFYKKWREIHPSHEDIRHQQFEKWGLQDLTNDPVLLSELKVSKTYGLDTLEARELGNVLDNGGKVPVDVGGASLVPGTLSTCQALVEKGFLEITGTDCRYYKLTERGKTVADALQKPQA
jgi:hypothetical protein